MNCPFPDHFSLSKVSHAGRHCISTYSSLDICPIATNEMGITYLQRESKRNKRKTRISGGFKNINNSSIKHCILFQRQRVKARYGRCIRATITRGRALLSCQKIWLLRLLMTPCGGRALRQHQRRKINNRKCHTERAEDHPLWEWTRIEKEGVKKNTFFTHWWSQSRFPT